MLLFRDTRTGDVLKKEDQIDNELLLRRMQLGNWKEVINELFDAPMDNAQMYNLKVLTAFAHWGLEEYEKGRSGGRTGRSTLRGWNI